METPGPRRRTDTRRRQGRISHASLPASRSEAEPRKGRARSGSAPKRAHGRLRRRAAGPGQGGGSGRVARRVRSRRGDPRLDSRKPRGRLGSDDARATRPWGEAPLGSRAAGERRGAREGESFLRRLRRSIARRTGRLATTRLEAPPGPRRCRDLSDAGGPSVDRHNAVFGHEEAMRSELERRANLLNRYSQGRGVGPATPRPRPTSPRA